LPGVNICSKHLFMPGDQGDGTRERVMEAAAELFAERGFRGATMRAIAERAGTNLASAHYHFGSKEKLYLDVAVELFLALERRLEEKGLLREEADLDGCSRQELIAQLRARIQTLLESLLEHPGHHGTLMLRELCDPTAALGEIVARFIDPMRRQMAALVRRLEPALDEDDAERCVRSIVGQIYFYRTHRAGLLLMMGRRGYPRDFARKTADHVTAFSLGGVERLAADRRRRRAPKEVSCEGAS
jgi:TetR/AcrR family transcriptional regulator, regulator of cefoperazone and chloramphenicol sensitivity